VIFGDGLDWFRVGEKFEVMQRGSLTGTMKKSAPPQRRASYETHGGQQVNLFFS
jgi:hypothetical protein